ARGLLDKCVTVALSKDGKRPAAACWEWWHLSGECAGRRQREEHLWGLALSKDGKLLAWSNGGNKVVFRGRGGKIARLIVAPSAVRCVALAEDGKLLAAGCEKGHVRVWDVSNYPKDPEELLEAGFQHKERVNCVAFSRDGDRLASAAGRSARASWLVG